MIQETDKENSAILSYIKGLSYFNLDLYDSAINSFLSAEKVLPMKQELYRNIGIAYYYKNDLRKAISYFEKAILFDPSYKLAEQNYYLVENLLKTKKDGRKPSILPFPDLSSSYLSTGWFFYYLQNIPEAIYYFKAAIKESPDYVMGYMALGILYDTINNYPTALEYYKKALELEPRYPDLQNNIGITYYNLNLIFEAEKSFLKAIELNSHYPYSYNNLGFLYLFKSPSDRDKSGKYFLLSIEHNKIYPDLLGESYAGLAVFYYLQKSFPEARRCKILALENNGRLYQPSYLENYLKWEKKYIDIFNEISL